ncbi:hypothetical protein HanRHA438_Chr17g0825621 [Helianthus annuus]|nr:hypothetical protein HanHA89_Chr17g0716911 [Helianthus annuus]KAJ0633328.1 hypothetical protein HanLR1_Chr17g0675431 [Helianthus annuus]KAJ0827430.1 hypothetical protein HanRHA438_Chr17g0825621 [Helianthus annuus]
MSSEINTPLLARASTVAILSISARQTKMLHLRGTQLHQSMTYRLLKSLFESNKFLTAATLNEGEPLPIHFQPSFLSARTTTSRA